MLQKYPQLFAKVHDKQSKVGCALRKSQYAAAIKTRSSAQ